MILAVGAAAQAQGALAQSSTSGALAEAQNTRSDLFARDRSVAVRDRPHPAYEAFGVPVGPAFTAYPKVEVSAESTDNVFAVANGADSDVVYHIKPELQVSSDWSRNAIAAFARADIARYQDFDTENHEDWSVGAQGRLDVTRATNINGGVSAARAAEPRTSASSQVASAKPIEYNLNAAYVAGTTVRGRTKLSARGDYRSYDYHDGATSAGAVVDQDSRDRVVTSLTGRGDYALSPATAVFVQVTGNDRNYDIASTPLVPARDSKGYEVLAGANFEVGALARGELAVGYIDQQFENSAYGDVSGFGARGSLEWFPTQLTTVTATGARTIEDSAIVGSGGYLSSSVGLTVDHELARNIILSGNLTYGNDDYDGIDRTDKRFGATASGTYLINRHLGATLAASHYEQSSDGTASGASFDVNKLMVSLVAQF